MLLRRALFAWLAFALVAAQALGFVHRVSHGPQAAFHAAGPDVHWTAALFGAHADDNTCRVLDAVGHDAAPASLATALPLALPSFLLTALQGECVFRFSAFFEARGPPAIR